MSWLKLKYTILGLTVGAVYFLCVFAFSLGSLQPFDFKVFLYFMILTPLLEEFLFRGVLQKKLLKHLKGGFFAISFANILTSAVFASFHLIFSGIEHSFAVLIPSILFGYLYEKSSSLIPPIITHAFLNVNIFIIYNVYIFEKLF